MSTETTTVLDSAVTGTAAAPMDVSVNATSEVVAAPKKRGRKPKTEGAVTGTVAAPKKGVKKGPTDSKKKDVEESSEDKPKKKAKKETSEKKDEEEDVKDTKEKKPRAKKEKSTKEDVKDGDAKEDAKNGDSKPKKRARKTGSKTNADGSPKKPRPLSSYMFFFKTIRAKVASENPSLKTTEIGRKLGEMWRALSEDEKKAFKSNELASQPAVSKDVVCCGTQI
jgi:hypothetical protein